MATQQVVVTLSGHHRGQPASRGDRVRLRMAPCREVALADEADLALLNQVVEWLEDLLGCHVGLRVVLLIQIDVVRLQLDEAAVDALDDPLA